MKNEELLDAMNERLDRIEVAVKNLQDSDDLINADEAANLLGISRSALYEKTCSKQGLPPELPHFKFGKRLFFSRKALQELIRGSKVKSRYDITK